mmetsp:Transcript_20269/g.39405  ORF Transcript_20269/g.39405 Transcript_20269/m.39405 type:complete len:300 (+) Transcript_20269:265-1164(+)
MIIAGSTTLQPRAGVGAPKRRAHVTDAVCARALSRETASSRVQETLGEESMFGGAGVGGAVTRCARRGRRRRAACAGLSRRLRLRRRSVQASAARRRHLLPHRQGRASYRAAGRPRSPGTRRRLRLRCRRCRYAYAAAAAASRSAVSRAPPSCTRARPAAQRQAAPNAPSTRDRIRAPRRPRRRGRPDACAATASRRLRPGHSRAQPSPRPCSTCPRSAQTRRAPARSPARCPCPRSPCQRPKCVILAHLLAGRMRDREHTTTRADLRPRLTNSHSHAHSHERCPLRPPWVEHSSQVFH